MKKQCICLKAELLQGRAGNGKGWERTLTACRASRGSWLKPSGAVQALQTPIMATLLQLHLHLRCVAAHATAWLERVLSLPFPHAAIMCVGKTSRTPLRHPNAQKMPVLDSWRALQDFLEYGKNTDRGGL